MDSYHIRRSCLERICHRRRPKAPLKLGLSNKPNRPIMQWLGNKINLNQIYFDYNYDKTQLKHEMPLCGKVLKQYYLLSTVIYNTGLVIHEFARWSLDHKF